MLVLVQSPYIVWDLKYATEDNFTGQVLYKSSRCFLEEEVAKCLYKAAECAHEKGCKLKIWDAYRPLSVQWALWNHTPDERFVAHPEKGGKHPRGTAVDLTLVDSQGRELTMPTPFDDFTEKAFRSCCDLSEEAIDNRQLLEDVMEGFIGLPNEWWHFDYHKWEEFKPQDIAIEDL